MITGGGTGLPRDAAPAGGGGAAPGGEATRSSNGEGGLPNSAVDRAGEAPALVALVQARKAAGGGGGAAGGESPSPSVRETASAQHQQLQLQQQQVSTHANPSWTKQAPACSLDIF